MGIFEAKSTSGDEGVLRGRTIATTDTNEGRTLVIDFRWRGFYTVNSDGTGVFTIADPALSAQACFDSTAAPAGPGPNPIPVPPPPPRMKCPDDNEGDESYAFVLSIHGDDTVIDFIQTDNVQGGAKIFMTGQARRQGSPPPGPPSDGGTSTKGGTSRWGLHSAACEGLRQQVSDYARMVRSLQDLLNGPPGLQESQRRRWQAAIQTYSEAIEDLLAEIGERCQPVRRPSEGQDSLRRLQ